jgi:putative endopeptidase
MARGINPDYLDIETSPEDDFYQFVNGGWMKNTEIPSDRSIWGSFHELAKRTDEKNIALLVDSSVDVETESNKAATLYQTGMDTTQIEKKKLHVLKDIFNAISLQIEKSHYGSLLGFLVSKGLGGIVHFSVHPDLGDSHIYAAYLEPGSQGLPERDFYLDEDERAENIRNHYLKYITRLFHV